MNTSSTNSARSDGLYKIVCFGNGTGQAALLQGFKNIPCTLTSIVGVTDNGGHSGLLRRELNIPSPGDLRRCLVALADSKLPLAKFLGHRFIEGGLKGVNLGNLVIAALIQQEGALSDASKLLCRMLQLKARVFPVSDENTQVCAELTDGTCLIGEWEIIERQPQTPIQRVYLQQPIHVYEGCQQAIAEADFIVFCPGSLFTGLIPLLLTEGIKETLASSQATKVYFCNLLTQTGQTDEFTLRDHVRQLSYYLPASPDYIVANNGPIPQELLEYYEGSNSCPVPLDRVEHESKLITVDLVDHGEKKAGEVLRAYGKGVKGGLHWIAHHPVKSAQVLLQIMKQ